MKSLVFLFFLSFQLLCHGQKTYEVILRDSIIGNNTFELLNIQDNDVKIQLADTISNYTIYRIDYLDVFQYSNYTSKPNSLSKRDTLESIFIMIYENSEYTFLAFDNNLNGSFLDENIQQIKNIDTIYLTFWNETLTYCEEVPFIVEKNSIDNYHRFYTFQSLYGTVNINNTDYDVKVWPYQMGPKYKFDIEGNYSVAYMNEFYFMDEPVLSNDATLEVLNYSYSDKIITFKSKEISSPPFGYKPNYKVKCQRLKVNNCGRSRLLYFGGKWCRHCKKDTPKLRNIQKLLTKNNIDLYYVLAQVKETESELNTYFNDNDLPGKMVIEKMDDPNSWIKYLNIMFYPCYVLIDENDIIVYRSDIGKIELNDFLFSYLNNNF